MSLVDQNPNPQSEVSDSGPKEPISPATWNFEALNKNWIDYLGGLARESNIPLKRLHYQLEQSPNYQEIVQRWGKMDGAERVSAWKKLIEVSEKLAAEILPSCVQCGECCRKGSPTLQLEDLDLLSQGKIPWDCLVTLRRGEPVRSPFEDKLVFLVDERIKIREKPETQECEFLDSESSLCTVYEDRPVQCRAQVCWDSAEAKQLAKQPYLTRRDIFKEVELLLKLIAEHDDRFAFAKLQAAFSRLEETRGESVQEIIQLLAQERHYRHFLAEQLNIPGNMLELVFGRSFEKLVTLFGFKVRVEEDGSRCLTLDRPEE
jgi:Fe-S-cluster containining protein